MGGTERTRTRDSSDDQSPGGQAEAPMQRPQGDGSRAGAASGPALGSPQAGPGLCEDSRGSPNSGDKPGLSLYFLLD